MEARRGAQRGEIFPIKSRIEPLNLSQAASLPSHPLRPPAACRAEASERRPVPSPIPSPILMGEGQGEGINSDGRGEGQGEVRALCFHWMFDV